MEKPAACKKQAADLLFIFFNFEAVTYFSDRTDRERSIRSSLIKLFPQIVNVKSDGIVFIARRQISPHFLVNLIIGQHSSFIGNQKEKNLVLFCCEPDLLPIPKNFVLIGIDFKAGKR